MVDDIVLEDGETVDDEDETPMPKNDPVPEGDSE